MMTSYKNKKAQAGLVMLVCLVAVIAFIKITQKESVVKEPLEHTKSSKRQLLTKPSKQSQEVYQQEASKSNRPFQQAKKASANTARGFTILSNNQSRQSLFSYTYRETEQSSTERRTISTTFRRRVSPNASPLSIFDALDPDNTLGRDSQNSSGEALASVDQIELAPSERAQVEAIRALGIDGISEEEKQFAYDYISNGTPLDDTRQEVYHWFSDELLISLRDQETVPSDFAEMLIDNLGNNPDRELRDYAAQHLGHVHEAGGSGVEGEIQSIEDALWEATFLTEGTASGSALIALNQASEKNRLQSNFDLEGRAIEILKGSYSVETKVSALDILEGSTNPEYLQLANDFKNNGNTPRIIQAKLTTI